MPNVKGSQGSKQGGYHTSGQIKKTMKPAYARDDIDFAYAGDENHGPVSDPKIEQPHSTNVKSRKTETSKLRTPKH